MPDYEFGWMATLALQGETAETETDARFALLLLFPEVPLGADLEHVADDAWLVTLPTEVADRVRDGEEYAETAVLVDAHGSEHLASIVVSPSL